LPKAKKSKVKCANCGEAYTPNSKESSACKNAIEKAHPKNFKAVQ